MDPQLLQLLMQSGASLPGGVEASGIAGQPGADPMAEPPSGALTPQSPFAKMGKSMGQGLGQGMKEDAQPPQPGAPATGGKNPDPSQAIAAMSQGGRGLSGGMPGGGMGMQMPGAPSAAPMQHNQFGAKQSPFAAMQDPNKKPGAIW